jgi:predicted nucleotidyltransferase
MKESRIETRMFEAAKDKSVIPIAGRERGSRMIGVAHDDSDWDAFLLFAQPAEEYATISGYTDTLSRKFEDGDIDIHGWNVQKLAELALDSNPNATEFLMSDTQYFCKSDKIGELLDKCREEMLHNFNHMALYHHYLSLATSNYEKYVASGNDCTSNRQFYVTRATAMAKYIRCEGAWPPLDVWELLRSETVLEQDERNLLEILSHKKKRGELDEMPDQCGPFLDREKDAEMEPQDDRINQPNKETFNELIVEAVK